MNYGYDNQCKGWNEAKSGELATQLAILCEGYTDEHGMQPYVEQNGLYQGVRIRRITHLNQDHRKEIVAKADGLYTQVMEG